MCSSHTVNSNWNECCWPGGLWGGGIIHRNTHVAEHPQWLMGVLLPCFGPGGFYTDPELSCKFFRLSFCVSDHFPNSVFIAELLIFQRFLQVK